VCSPPPRLFVPPPPQSRRRCHGIRKARSCAVSYPTTVRAAVRLHPFLGRGSRCSSGARMGPPLRALQHRLTTRRHPQRPRAHRFQPPRYAGRAPQRRVSTRHHPQRPGARRFEPPRGQDLLGRAVSPPIGTASPPLLSLTMETNARSKTRGGR
jgi:hypothetical protein